jgi:hypothetical protein
MFEPDPKIIRNSAKCNACGIQIESKSGHDFNVHRCKPDDPNWKFAVDGGRNYIRRCGSGYTDTSIYAGETE